MLLNLSQMESKQLAKNLILTEGVIKQGIVPKRDCLPKHLYRTVVCSSRINIIHQRYI